MYKVFRKKNVSDDKFHTLPEEIQNIYKLLQRLLISITIA